MRFTITLPAILLVATYANTALASPNQQNTKDMPPIKQEVVKQPAPSYGQLLYENHCIACHTSVVHVREKHRATNREMLRSWVVKWSSHQKLEWSDLEINAVSDYLAQRFYEFEKKQ